MEFVTVRFSVGLSNCAAISSNLSFYFSCWQKKPSIGLLSRLWLEENDRLFSQRICRRNERFFCQSNVSRLIKDETFIVPVSEQSCREDLTLWERKSLQWDFLSTDGTSFLFIKLNQNWFLLELRSFVVRHG